MRIDTPAPHTSTGTTTRADTAHEMGSDLEDNPPPHTHKHKTTGRTALLLILGSSPMVEGIPAFFAASRYGGALVAVMSSP